MSGKARCSRAAMTQDDKNKERIKKRNPIFESFLLLESKIPEVPVGWRELWLPAWPLGQAGAQLEGDPAAQQEPHWGAACSTLIGRAMSRLVSHWSRVLLAPALLCHKEPARRIQTQNTPRGVFCLLLAGSLWHKDRWLPCTERSYYRRHWSPMRVLDISRLARVWPVQPRWGVTPT